MADIRIETDKAILEEFPEGNHEFSPEQMTEEVTNYWGSLEQEKLFPIMYWRAEELLSSSPSKQLAFKVTSIDQKADMKAEWISYDPDNPTVSAEVQTPGGLIGFLQRLIDSLKNALQPEPPVALFVFGEEFFPLSGNLALKQFPAQHLMTIVGRIGERSTGEKVAFIVAANLTIKGPGGGGPGGASGAKIPADGDPNP